MTRTNNYSEYLHEYVQHEAFDESVEILKDIVEKFNNITESEEHATMPIGFSETEPDKWSIGFYEGIPVLGFTYAADTGCESDGKVHHRYLALFRGYKIQASATFEGECDCGGTTVNTHITELVKSDDGQWAFAELCVMVLRRAGATHTIKNLDIFNAWLELTFQFMEQNIEYFEELYRGR